MRHWGAAVDIDSDKLKFLQEGVSCSLSLKNIHVVWITYAVIPKTAYFIQIYLTQISSEIFVFINY